MKFKNTYLIILVLTAISFEGFAQLSETKAAENHGAFLDVQFGGIMISDKHALYEPHQKHGYPSFQIAFQTYEYKPGGLRHRVTSDLATDGLYFLALLAAKKDNKGDFDGRFGKTSYLSTVLFDYSFQIPVYTNYFMSTGIGGVLHDLRYSHYLYDANGQPDNPQKSDVDQYGFYGGWSAFVDVMLHQSLTLHTDFYYSYGLYNGSQEKLKKSGEPSQPFNTWRLTTKLLHSSGFFVGSYYHQAVNKTSINTAASRFNLGVGYRLLIKKYD